MAGTIIVDRIESDASYASNINVASQITFSNTVNFGITSAVPVAGFYSPSTNNLAFTTTSTERMRINASGNVGIGTASPTQKLQVAGNVFVSAGQYFMWDNAGAWSWQSDASTYLRAYYAGNEALRIDSSGQLILKRTAAVNAATLVCSATQNTRAVSFVNNNNNNEVGYIFLQNDGTTTQYATTSDYRLKENIVPMTNALSVVAQLKPVKYKWKINGADGQGFIAHELQAVIPDCVTGEKDDVETYTDEDGNEQTKPKYQGIDTSFLVATLTAAIQELKAINDTQAATITSLTETITALTARVVALEA
jgi:hypothetical protein